MIPWFPIVSCLFSGIHKLSALSLVWGGFLLALSRLHEASGPRSLVFCISLEFGTTLLHNHVSSIMRDEDEQKEECRQKQEAAHDLMVDLTLIPIQNSRNYRIRKETASIRINSRGCTS
jgi:hypothetical protein